MPTPVSDGAGDGSPPSESAVLVPVPPAEPVAAPHRVRFDRAAGWGVPAHVTVLYPFVPPARIDDRVMQALAAAVASVPAFEASWPTTGWFGEKVLWLAPEPAQCFAALTEAVAGTFPAFPPYGGQHEAVVPHLTLGHDADPEQLREVERQVETLLPIRMQVTTAALWCGAPRPGSWRQVASLPLGH